MLRDASLRIRTSCICFFSACPEQLAVAMQSHFQTTGSQKRTHTRLGAQILALLIKGLRVGMGIAFRNTFEGIEDDFAARHAPRPAHDG
jgi:hypothetical protein